MRIVTGQEMADIDRHAIQDFGVDGQLLMECAGRAVVEVIGRRFPQARHLCVLCGPGNNGGDGLVVARTWHNRGGTVDVFVLGNPEGYRGDAGLNLQRMRRANLSVKVLDCDHWPGFESYDLVVDALFGTGLTRPLEGSVAQLVAAVNRSSAPVLAIDIPSGVDSATGEVLGCAVRAQVTVTFGLPKLGHYLHPGAEARGCLHIEEIGFPRSLLEDHSRGGILVDPTQVRLPRRGPAAHKGSCGKALLWVGSRDYPGAATLCARGALRGGAGLVYVAAADGVAGPLMTHVPEAIAIPLDPAQQEAVQIRSLLEGQRALCIGPGFGTDPQRLHGLQALLASDEALPPLVLDADALRALPPGPLGRPAVLTPHPGEMARMLGLSVAEVEAGRVRLALRAAMRWGCLVVLKGAPTVVAGPDGRYWINSSGHPVLAQGGTGDVLAGLIAAFLAQGADSDAAAVAGVYVHGRAGERCAQNRDRGVLAREIADEIPEVMGELLVK